MQCSRKPAHNSARRAGEGLGVRSLWLEQLDAESAHGPGEADKAGDGDEGASGQGGPEAQASEQGGEETKTPHGAAKAGTRTATAA